MKLVEEISIDEKVPSLVEIFIYEKVLPPLVLIGVIDFSVLPLLSNTQSLISFPFFTFYNEKGTPCGLKRLARRRTQDSTACIVVEVEYQL